MEEKGKIFENFSEEVIKREVDDSENKKIITSTSDLSPEDRVNFKLFNNTPIENTPKKPCDSKNIHKGHRKRLRETYLNVDPMSLSEIQLLELLLSFAQPMKDVNPLSHRLLNEFGSIANVLDASQSSLKRIDGVGEVLSCYLNFCAKLPEIYRTSRAKSKALLQTPAEIISYLKKSVEFGNSVEKFYYVCLNTKGEVLCFKSMGSGSISKLYVNNRELISQILRYPTHSVVFCHTHPHGIPKPSSEDINFTKSLHELLKTLNIRLCDHIILSPDGCFSFFKADLLGAPINQNDFENLKMDTGHFDF